MKPRLRILPTTSVQMNQRKIDQRAIIGPGKVVVDNCLHAKFVQALTSSLWSAKIGSLWSSYTKL